MCKHWSSSHRIGAKEMLVAKFKLRNNKGPEVNGNLIRMHYQHGHRYHRREFLPELPSICVDATIGSLSEGCPVGLTAAAGERLRQAWNLRGTRAFVEVMSAARRAVDANPLTASARDRALVKSQQAKNEREQAKTIAKVGMSVVERSTRNNRRVECICVNCSNTRFSQHTVPSSRVGNSEREIEEYDVDENERRIGEPVRIHADLQTAGKEIPCSSINAIRPIVRNSVDGGLLPESIKKLPNGERRPPRWLRYVPRKPNMIVTPPCNKCSHCTKPIDRDLEIRVDYVNYVPLKRLWARAKAQELQELCKELGINVKAGLSEAALQEKLDKHYNGDEGKSK
mmetsp:Transcript_497/g.1165  ORF Transcript_497/g.1165 Transcript_497/m.1165 type:complete len:341 (-) Transcript_497:4-1026(-)